jgi:3-oxoacyl-[acyl-carrier-protein] synthase-3
MFKNNSAPVFSDAGSASLIEYDKSAPKSYFNIYSDGNEYDSLMCSNGGFRNYPKKEDFYENGEYIYDSHMNGGRIFEFTIGNITPSILALLDFAQEDITNIDYFIFHQANKIILENIARQLNIDIDKMPMETISKYGNQCGASIPCTINDVLKEKVHNTNNRLLMSGFGVGLSWANAIINLDNAYCSGIKEYKENNNE